MLLSLACCLWLSNPPSIAQPENLATSEMTNANKLVQQGVDYYQAGDYQAAIKPWENALKFYQDTSNHEYSATVQENLARAYQKIGDIEEEIRYWKQAINNYEELRDQRQMGLVATELAQAYSRFGQSRKAIALLCGSSDAQEAVTCTGGSLEIAKQFADREGEMAALGSLGEAYRLRGKYERAIARFKESLEIAQELNNLVAQASNLNNLGNAYWTIAQLTNSYANSAQQRGAKNREREYLENALSEYNQALTYFQESLQLASSQNDLFAQMRALQFIKRYHRLEEVRQRLKAIRPWATGSPMHENPSLLVSASLSPHLSLNVEATIQQVLELLNQLPDSRDKVYAAIELAQLKPLTSVDDPSQPNYCYKRQLEGQAETLLNLAVSIAQKLEDYRAQSFALGELGHTYECYQDYQKALEFTQQAQWAANQNLSAKDSLYLWQWQAGRIFLAQGKKTEAINAYQQASATLNDIGSDLLIAQQYQKFDFRDAINPFYREFVQLRLELAESSLAADSQEYQEELEFALETIDCLKMTELQNYSAYDCALIPISQERVDKLVGEKTAIFRSIILSDRTVILVSLPNGKKRLEWINTDSQTLQDEINEFRRGLERSRDIIYNPKPAQELYHKIIAPFTADFESAQIETLVFIQDGILWSIPMAALHDGKKFLVESYAIAITPSLQLTNPQTLNRNKLRVLALGLSEASEVNGHKFPALRNVEAELQAVEAQFPGSTVLRNGDFTEERLKDELDQATYAILHIATHGQFSAIQRNTFLVTGNNGHLTLEDLESTISNVSHQPNFGELLALTACQTAVGDDREVLGLAGIAVLSGVNSALASLWSIDDASTPQLVTEFYANLRRPGVSKAEALRAAQRTLIEAKKREEIKDKYDHPYYWAPFILIGNWL
ncbi:MAG: CHAT domain-containing protein [Symploca sp. SIO1C2]|nr:CHAT domain-containing protein [Symploca sp. SIO1C2]